MDVVHRAGNTVGGIFEVVAHNVVTGLGSHAQWDEKLDGRLAQAVMSIQAVKGVEIGAGIAAATSYGSEVMDEIGYDAAAKTFTRPSNRAGGLEGGITNGQDVIVRGYLKPISTLRTPLGTVDMVTKQPISAAYERSDVCVVPAGGVAGRSHGFAGARASDDRKVWRRLVGRDAPQFRRVRAAVEGILKPQINTDEHRSDKIYSQEQDQCLSVFICGFNESSERLR